MLTVVSLGGLVLTAAEVRAIAAKSTGMIDIRTTGNQKNRLKSLTITALECLGSKLSRFCNLLLRRRCAITRRLRRVRSFRRFQLFILEIVVFERITFEIVLVANGTPVVCASTAFAKRFVVTRL